MKNVILLLILSFIVSGCATAKSINKNYAKINFADGVSVREAKLIAKKALIDSAFSGHYRAIVPRLVRNEYTRPHPNYWFIKAKPKQIIFDDSAYLVVIDKRNGEVIYAAKNYPNPYFRKGYRWIINMHESKEIVRE